MRQPFARSGRTFSEERDTRRVRRLDEPSLGLAPQIAEQMFQTIAKIRHGGHSILIVEQDIAGTLEIADYGYVMENGRITIEGEPALLRNNPQVLASYLGGHVS